MSDFRPIIKQTACDVLGGIGLYSNGSKRYWYDDNGFFLTLFEVAPCNLGGIFLNMGIYPFWCDCSSLSWHPIDSDSGRLTSPDVPQVAEALLYWKTTGKADVDFDTPITSDEFERYFRILLNVAKRKFEIDYKELTDPGIFCERLENRKDTWLVRENGRIIDLDHAIGEMIAGHREKARMLMQYALEYGTRPETVAQAKEMLPYTDSREVWLGYINGRIEKGRNVLSAKLKFLNKQAFRFE